MKKKPRIAIALGSGSARGWAHIGVLNTLSEMGIEPDIVCGCSIGSLVGAAYACDQLSELEEWVETLDWKKVVSLLDVSFGGGVIEGKKLLDFFQSKFKDHQIESLEKSYAAVATDLEQGTEVWLQKGSVLAAMRASISLPGLFSPVKREGRWLVDGALVNPVPISLCRAYGADIVIAVDLNSDLLHRHVNQPIVTSSSAPSLAQELLRKVNNFRDRFVEDKNEEKALSLLDVLPHSLNIMQVRITRSRMAGDPPDLLITPHLADIGLMEFHRAKEGIKEGAAATMRKSAELQALVDGY